MTLLFKAPKRALVAALERAVAVADAKSTMPTLKCVRFRAAGDALVADATDLYASVSAVVADAESIAPSCDVAVEARAFLARVKSLENGPVTVEETLGSITARTSKTRKFSMPKLPGADYPPLPRTADARPLVTLPAADLAHVLAGVSYAMSVDSARAHMHATLLRLGDGKILGVATDGHRMAVRERPAKPIRDANLVVPAPMIKVLAGSLDEASDVELATLGENHLVARQSDVTMTFKLVDAQFVPYEQVIPQGQPHKVTIDRSRWLEGAKAVGVASDEHHRLELVFSADRLTMRAESPMGGEFTDEMSASFEGGDGKGTRIAVDGRYVVEPLASLAEEDELVVELGGELDPMILRGSDTLAVVMPMRW